MVTETLELKGHLLDSLILPKVLDEILERDGRFEILEMAVGERASDMSHVRLRVEANAPEVLEAMRNSPRRRWTVCFRKGSTSPRISPRSCASRTAGSRSNPCGWTAASSTI